MKDKSKSKKSTKNTKQELKVFKNNSAFKRSMVQMDVKSGDKITVIYNDGSTYSVERT
jgi:hypothetical protein